MILLKYLELLLSLIKYLKNPIAFLTVLIAVLILCCFNLILHPMEDSLPELVIENPIKTLIILGFLFAVLSWVLINKETRGKIEEEREVFKKKWLKIYLVSVFLYCIALISVYQFVKPPIPAPDRFVVLVANFEKDDDSKNDKELSVKSIVLSDLKRELPEDQVYPVEETLELQGPILDEAVKTENIKAEGILLKNHGDLLVWGKVERLDGKTSIDLYWNGLNKTSSFNTEREYKINDAHLGNVFLTDVASFLKLIVVMRATDIFNKSNYFVADHDLPPEN
jgi:hypothetical protein